MDENNSLEEGAPTKGNESQKANPEDGGVDSSNKVMKPKYPQPEFDDYWAYKIAELTKKKVLTYFAVLGILVSLLITLFGMDRIRALVDEQYVNRIKDKEKQASERVESLANTFETKLKSLQSRAETRSQEFHRIVGVTLTQIQMKQTSTSEIKVDLSNEIGPIRDQGAEGTTVGFSLAYALTAEHKRVTGKIVIFSARSIYVEAKRHDEWEGDDYPGTSVLGGVKALKEVGAYLDNDWPYHQKDHPLPKKEPAQKITTYTKIPVDGLDQIISSLNSGKVVIVGLKVTRDFYNPERDGKISLTDKSGFIGGHSVCIVGYNGDTDEFKFANMWSKSWGDSGFGYMRQSDLKTIIKNAFTLSI